MKQVVRLQASSRCIPGHSLYSEAFGCISQNTHIAWPGFQFFFLLSFYRDSQYEFAQEIVNQNMFCRDGVTPSLQRLTKPLPIDYENLAFIF